LQKKKNESFKLRVVQKLGIFDLYCSNLKFPKKKKNCSGIPSIYLGILFDCKGVAMFVSFGPPLVFDVHK
jgi:hypothetical protein